jgi:hypothetical protein
MGNGFGRKSKGCNICASIDEDKRYKDLGTEK